MMISASNENSGNARRVKELVDDVTAANERQARGLHEIATALPQLEKATQGIAASSEESAAAAEELSSGAETLRSVAKELDGIVSGFRRTCGQVSSSGC